MATSKYAQRLSSDDKVVKAEQVVLAEANAKAQTEQAISGYNAKIATSAAALNAALASPNFNINEVVRLTKELKTLKEDQAAIKAVYDDQFTVTE